MVTSEPFPSCQNPLTGVYVCVIKPRTNIVEWFDTGNFDFKVMKHITNGKLWAAFRRSRPNSDGTPRTLCYGLIRLAKTPTLARHLGKSVKFVWRMRVLKYATCHKGKGTIMFGKRGDITVHLFGMPELESAIVFNGVRKRGTRLEDDAEYAWDRLASGGLER